MGLTPDFDPEQPAHRTGKAIAADKVPSPHRLRAAALPVKQRCRYAAGVLRKARQLDAMPDGNVRKRARVFLQDRIEPGLRAWHAPLGADWQMRQVFQGRYAHAAELVSLHVGNEHAVERPVARKPPAAHLVDDTELAAELHGPNTDFEHLRRIELVLSLLDQHGRYAAPPKVGRERKSNGAAAGDPD